MTLSKIQVAVEIPEESETVFCSIIRLGRSAMIWAGTTNDMGSMSMAVPGRDGSAALW
jgi:hypothetical protein